MEYPIDKSESKGNLGTETFTLKRRDSCSFCDAEVNASKIKDLEAKIEQIKLENSGHYLEWRRSESIIKELEKNLRKAHISEADAQEDAIFHRDQLSLHSMKVAELEKKLTSTQRTLELGKNLHHTLMANHDDNIERIEAKLKVAEMALEKMKDARRNGDGSVINDGSVFVKEATSALEKIKAK